VANINTEEHDGRLRTTVELEPGEQVWLCRCWKSARFPLCDGSHKQVEGQVAPVGVKARASDEK
jgi:CDGSH-type Zn-finger protein